jgi:hypothetical protein
VVVVSAAVEAGAVPASTAAAVTPQAKTAADTAISTNAFNQPMSQPPRPKGPAGPQSLVLLPLRPEAPSVEGRTQKDPPRGGYFGRLMTLFEAA